MAQYENSFLFPFLFFFYRTATSIIQKKEIFYTDIGALKSKNIYRNKKIVVFHQRHHHYYCYLKYPFCFGFPLERGREKGNDFLVRQL